MYGLPTLAWLNEQQVATHRFNQERNAYNLAKLGEESSAAEADIGPKDFSVAKFNGEYWVLALNPYAARLASALFPAGTRRYGHYYVCNTPETRAIAIALSVPLED